MTYPVEFDTPEPKNKRKSKPARYNFGAKILLVGLCVLLAAVLMMQRLRPAATVVVVDAERGWQSTGITIPRNSLLEFTVMDGTWTNWDGNTPYTSGQGTGWICGRAMKPADCVEPLPSAPSDALIGRIGDQLFLIGSGTTLKAQQNNVLELRINDGDGGLYDNNGSLTVQIELN